MQRCPGDYTEIEWEWMCESLRACIHMCDRSLSFTDTSVEGMVGYTKAHSTRSECHRILPVKVNFLEHKGFYKVSNTSKITRQKLVTSNLRWVLKISTQSGWIPQQHDLLLIREHNKLGQLYVGFGLSNTMIVRMKNSVLKVINCRHLMELATARRIWYMISWAWNSTDNNGMLVNMTKS